MVCLDEKSGEMKEFLQPKGHGVMSELNHYYAKSEALSNKLNEIKKVLSKYKSIQFLEKPTE